MYVCLTGDDLILHINWNQQHVKFAEVTFIHHWIKGIIIFILQDISEFEGSFLKRIPWKL